MKLCWDNIYNLRLLKTGNFFDGKHVYVEKESCKNCGEPFLARIDGISESCSLSCNKSGRFHHNYNKKLTYVKNGKDHHRWSGGYEQSGLPPYNCTSTKLIGIDPIRRSYNNPDLLEVKCAYCGKWFIPSIISVRNRIAVIYGRQKGEQRFYCSDNCKQACPIFKTQWYPKGFKPATSREVQPELRQMVFDRDDYICQRCNKNIDEVQIHCHHIEPVSQNPIESADIDNCITLCKKCHKEVHKQNGCKYNELRCN